MAGEPDDFLDDEVPEMTDAQLAEVRPAREVMTPEEFASVTGRGRPRAAKPKVPVTIRLDQDVVEAFKATGKGWQTKINATLKRSTISGKLVSGKVVRTLAASALTQDGPKYSKVAGIKSRSSTEKTITMRSARRPKKDTA